MAGERCRRWLLVLLVAAVGGVSTSAFPAQERDAKTLWEQAIQAKGGRARLEGVRNLVVTSRTESVLVTSRTTVERTPERDWFRQWLYVFPGRRWQLIDFRPGRPSFSLMAFDLDRHSWWNQSGGPLRWTEGQANVFRYEMLKGQFLYLLESAFLKPALRRARTDKVGATLMDIVETEMPMGVRVEYDLDPESHLPLRVVVVTPWEPSSTYALNQYVDVDGLRMPTTVNFEGARERNVVSYRINVGYDEKMFAETPRTAAAASALALPEAWEPK
ncbi:MAG: hypothetical protein WBD07_00780 [Vicinamibacterales bacterium]